jgi:alpha-ketoglutarate-dependent taurine dioxygenase
LTSNFAYARTQNIGSELSTQHPVIRTNPVTGWKNVFAVGHHVQHINGLTDRESTHLLNEFLRMITENHDLQVRFKWNNQNDLGVYSFLLSFPFGLDVSRG